MIAFLKHEVTVPISAEEQNRRSLSMANAVSVVLLGLPVIGWLFGPILLAQLTGQIFRESSRRGRDLMRLFASAAFFCATLLLCAFIAADYSHVSIAIALVLPFIAAKICIAQTSKLDVNGV